MGLEPTTFISLTKSFCEYLCSCCLNIFPFWTINNNQNCFIFWKSLDQTMRFLMMIQGSKFIISFYYYNYVQFTSHCRSSVFQFLLVLQCFCHYASYLIVIIVIKRFLCLKFNNLAIVKAICRFKTC